MSNPYPGYFAIRELLPLSVPEKQLQVADTLKALDKCSNNHDNDCCDYCGVLKKCQKTYDRVMTAFEWPDGIEPLKLTDIIPKFHGDFTEEDGFS